MCLGWRMLVWRIIFQLNFDVLREMSQGILGLDS